MIDVRAERRNPQRRVDHPDIAIRAAGALFEALA